MIDTAKLTRNMKMRERRRAVVRTRLWQGILRLFRQPWTIIFPLLLVLAAALAWRYRTAVPLPGNTIPELAELWQIVLAALVIVFAALSLCGILVLLGTPRKAREIENGLADALSIPAEKDYRCPILVSCTKVKGTTAREYVFKSKQMNIERWNEKGTRDKILWVLNGHSDEPFTYGKRKYTIVIRIGAGRVPKEKESPQDPLFR